MTRKVTHDHVGGEEHLIEENAKSLRWKRAWCVQESERHSVR